VGTYNSFGLKYLNIRKGITPFGKIYGQDLEDKAIFNVDIQSGWVQDFKREEVMHHSNKRFKDKPSYANDPAQNKKSKRWQLTN